MQGPIEIVALVGQQSYRAGLAYAAQGRVALSSNDPEEGYAEGSCQGSTARPYGVFVEYTLTPSGTVTRMGGYCSCPVAYNCKHAVALLVTALDDSGVRRLGHESMPEAWRSSLGRIFAAPDPGTVPLALSFAFEPPRPPQDRPGRSPLSRWGAHLGSPGALNVRPLRPGKRSRWVTTGATWSSVGSGYVADADPAQVEALGQLLSLHHGSHRYDYSTPAWLPLAGESSAALWEVLGRLPELGISMVESGSLAPVRLEPEPASAEITVRSDASGALEVGAGLTHPGLAGAEVVELGSPPHGIAWRGPDGLHLARLASPATRQWQQLARERQPIRVPAPDRPAFESEVLPQLTRLGWSSPDGSFSPAPPPPPVLHLELAVSPIAEIGAVPRALLRWGWHYRAADGAGRGPLPLRPGPFDRGRDQAAEATLLGPVAEALKPLGAELLLASERPGLRMEPQPEAELTGMSVVRLLDEVLPRLVELGVVLEHGELPNYRMAGDPQVAASIGGEGRDWFDLEVSISVEGHEVPIALVITALTRGEETLFLPDGSYLDLRHSELERLKELLQEARELTDQRHRGIRVPRIRASWWEELLALGIVATSDHAWFQALREAATSPPEPAPSPHGLRAALRPYQEEGFRWLAGLRRAGLGGVLADDMGLGKTLQALAMILDEREQRCAAIDDDAEAAGLWRPGPWLVVAPTSVAPNWVAEALRFAPGLRVALVDSTQARRPETLRELAEGVDILVTSYALLRLEVDQYAELGVTGLILDEAQNAKNHTSKTFAAVKLVDAPVTFAITGTPMENDLGELWAMFALTAPGLLGSPSQFMQLYRRPIERGYDDRVELLRRLRRRVAPFLLRRTKDAVASDLPPKQEQVVRVELAPAHRRIYDRHLQRERQRVLKLAEDLDGNRIEVLSALTRLRQLAIDPALVEEGSTAASSKLDVLLPLLEEAAREGHRVLVFSQFTRYLRRIAERLSAAGMGYSYLDGATPRRGAVIEGFATGDDPVFLISLKAGGVGLNLTMADYAILADPWWNPATEAQAVDRAHRIGQTRPVHVYRLVASDTIEEKVLALQESKQALIAEVLGAAPENGEAEGGPERNGRVGGAQLSAEDLRLLLS